MNIRKIIQQQNHPKKGDTIKAVCKRFNHSSPAVTMRYLGIQDKEVKSILANKVIG